MIRQFVTLLACTASIPAILHPIPAQCQARAPVAAAAPIQMEHISVEVVGQGSPVFLIPGLSSPRAVWDGITPELAKTHRVYRIQVNGFGGDDPRGNKGPGMLDGIVADLVALIARERIAPPAVVGHSMGGLVGLMLAARHPDRVGRLMVVDAMPFIGPAMGVNTVDAIRPLAERARAATAAQPKSAPVTSDPGGIWSNTPAGRIQVANWTLAADPGAVAQALYEDMLTDMRPELRAITAKPFTVLYAAGVGEAVAKAVWEPQYAGSSARMIAVPDSYHFIMLDQPQRFAAEMQRFLAE